MKASIHIDGNEIFKSNRISLENLNIKSNQLKIENNCQRMTDIVKRKYRVFTSK